MRWARPVAIAEVRAPVWAGHESNHPPSSSGRRKPLKRLIPRAFGRPFLVGFGLHEGRMVVFSAFRRPFCAFLGRRNVCKRAGEAEAPREAGSLWATRW